jgi:capsular polysaccharide transport system permease protein
MINKLAAVTRDDTTKYSKEELDVAEQKLEDARAALTKFQVENNIVDPTEVLGADSAVVSALTSRLVDAQVQLEDLKQGAIGDSDPRVAALQRQIDIIQKRIDDERAKVGNSDGTTTTGYAKLMADFDRLKVDLEFSQKAYLTALASYDAAVAEAQHKQVYLATYEEPTLAQRTTSPRRWLILAAVLTVGFLTWSILTLVYYALRDRR